MKKKSLYKKSLLIFTLILLVLSAIFLIYVYRVMVSYEDNLIDNYLDNSISSGEILNYIDDYNSKNSYYENDVTFKDGLQTLLKSDDLKINKNINESTENKVAYDLFYQDNKIMTIYLSIKNSSIKIAILKIDEWQIDDVKTYDENGIFSYQIKVPENYEIYINDKIVNEKDKIDESDVEGMDRLKEYIKIYPTKTYEIKNLLNEPNIKILDENKKEIAYEIKDGKITISPNFIEKSTYDEAKSYLKEEIDVLAFAENWSLFFTNDSKFSSLTPYLINGSYMYDVAHAWTVNIDRTFVSKHTLKNPTFTNAEVKNFVIYNDNAFSCEVYLEKNMVVKNEDKVDIMHDRLFFIYYNGGYKLVDMQAISE